MGELLGLWLPILVSAVACFFASFVIWTVSKHHKPDYRGYPNEEALKELIRADNPPPGQYVFPYCEGWDDLKDPEKKAKHDAGPFGLLNVWPGDVNMGRNMGLTFLFFLVTSVFVAYACTLARDPGASFLEIFQVAGTAGIMAFCFAFIPNAIWFGKPCRCVCMDILDGLIYGLIAAAIFAGLWPGA
jgi:hypothetical protein